MTLDQVDRNVDHRSSTISDKLYLFLGETVLDGAEWESGGCIGIVLGAFGPKSPLLHDLGYLTALVSI